MSAWEAAGWALSSVPVGVGGADDPVPAPRDHEQHRLLGAQDDPGRRVDPVARHDQVDALGGAHVDLPAPADQLLDVVGPHAGGVDDLLGAYLELALGLQVADADAGDPLALAQEPHHLRPRGDLRAVRRRRCAAASST